MKNWPTAEQFWYWNDKIAFNLIVGIRQIIAYGILNLLIKEFEAYIRFTAHEYHGDRIS